MGNTTCMTALRGSIGKTRYYVCRMTFRELVRHGRFRHEIGGHPELTRVAELGIRNQSRGITEYLLKSPHRFLGGIVVAAWGGAPQYTPLSMEDPEGMLQGLDREFGVLTFDGTQAYFVLDGQHRLRAIKDAIKQNPELGKEDLCVLVVTHYDNVDGRMRTRRLFSNINRNAKQTGAAENVALDEDDGYAILTRRMLEDHELFKQEGRVRVILSTTEDGGIKLASGSVPKTDARAFTTFTVLYDVLRYLGYDLPGAMRIETRRPPDDVLESSYRVLVTRVDDLLKHCGDIRARLEAAASAREIRAPKNAEAEGHPFMRPVIQKAVARVVAQIMQQGGATWPVLMERLSELDWRMGSPPWLAVFSPDRGTMLVGKENADLLGELLVAHLAPSSMQAIKRARKGFKDIRGEQYPIPEDKLAERLPAEGEIPASPIPVILPTELSEKEIVIKDTSDQDLSLPADALESAEAIDASAATAAALETDPSMDEEPA